MKRGFTLLEVVVALVLMGSILVASVLAFSNHQRQLSLSKKRLRATRICEALVTQLRSQPGGTPVPAQGTVSGEPGWVWQTRWAGTTTIATIPLKVVELEVLQSSPTALPLVSVQWVQTNNRP